MSLIYERALKRFNIIIIMIYCSARIMCIVLSADVEIHNRVARDRPPVCFTYSPEHQHQQREII